MSEDDKLVAALPLYIRAYLEYNRDNAIYQASMAEYWATLLSGVTVGKYPEGLVEARYAEMLAEAETAYENFLTAYGPSYYPTIEDFYAYFFGKSYVPLEGETPEETLYRMAEGEIKQNLILYYVLSAEGLLPTPEEEEALYQKELAELLDYYNDYYGLAGTEGELTEADLASAGYTREVIVRDALYQSFCSAMYEGYRDHIEFLPEA